MHALNAENRLVENGQHFHLGGIGIRNLLRGTGACCPLEMVV